MASEAGVKLVLNTDAHSSAGLELMEYAVATARRAWLGPDQILNTGPWWG
jgi:DNA polymerase (family 10)